MNIPYDWLYSIKKPNMTIKIHLKVKMDNGKIEQFASYRCQHNHHIKPCKGGVRIAPDVN